MPINPDGFTEAGMMRSDKKLYSIVLDIYREAYTKSDPPADLDKLMISGKTQKQNWFMDYYLPNGEYIKIIDKHCKKNKVTKLERKKMAFELFLGAGPSGVKKEV